MCRTSTHTLGREGFESGKLGSLGIVVESHG